MLHFTLQFELVLNPGRQPAAQQDFARDDANYCLLAISCKLEPDVPARGPDDDPSLELRAGVTLK